MVLPDWSDRRNAGALSPGLSGIRDKLRRDLGTVALAYAGTDERDWVYVGFTQLRVAPALGTAALTEEHDFVDTRYASADTAVTGLSDAAPLSISKISVFLTVVRRCGPHVIEASLIPTALFYSCLVLAGLGAAYAVALTWLYLAVARRLLQGKPVPPLLVLGLIGITARTAVSVASGSSFLYFAQPIAGSLVMGCVFLISIAFGRPMVERLALEFWPLTPEMLARPGVSRLLRGLTFLWAGVNVAIAATNLTLLLSLPLATYVAARQVTSLVISGLAVAITIDRSVHTARREGFVERPTRRRSAPALRAYG
jgi:hypothetical protein